jgi:phosphoglycerol transferase
LAAVLGIGIAAVALRLWALDPAVPLRYTGDAVQTLGLAQNVLETGWHLEGPRLNAPYGQAHHDFPQFGDLTFLMLSVAGAVTGSGPAAVTAVYLLTFPLVALATFWALRQLQVPAVVAVVGAVIYAVLPYHFARGTGQLLLAAYYAVPVAGYVVVTAAAGRLHGRLRMLVLGALVGLSSIYYSAFALLLLLPAALLGYARRRTLRSLAPAVIFGATILAVVGISSVPTLLYRAEVGTNVDVPVRESFDVETYGLRPAALFVPSADHRIPLLAQLGRRYEGFPRPGERGDTLGLVGAAGLAGLIVVGIGAAGGWRPWGRFGDRLRRVSALALVALASGVIGGLATFVALAASAQIRTWNRISIFLGFFAILAVCLVLGALWRASRGRRRQLIAIGLAMLVAGAAFDQTNGSTTPDYAGVGTAYASEDAFVDSVEAAFEPGAAIYQLPYIPYPEAGAIGSIKDYNHLAGYLHSESLRWSFGGMKGREAGWQPYAGVARGSPLLRVIAAAGFSAVWVDRRGYPDAGAAIESTLGAVAGASPMASADGRYAVYDVRQYVASLRASTGDVAWASLTDGVARPVWPRWESGVTRLIFDRTGFSRTARATARLTLVNSGDAAREVVLGLTLRPASATGTSATLRMPDGTSETYALPGEPLAVRRTIVLPPGETSIELITPGSDAIVRVSDVWVLDSNLLALAEAP